MNDQYKMDSMFVVCLFFHDFVVIVWSFVVFFALFSCFYFMYYERKNMNWVGWVGKN